MPLHDKIILRVEIILHNYCIGMKVRFLHFGFGIRETIRQRINFVRQILRKNNSLK